MPTTAAAEYINAIAAFVASIDIWHGESWLFWAARANDSNNIIATWVTWVLINKIPFVRSVKLAWSKKRQRAVDGCASLFCCANFRTSTIYNVVTG